MTTLRRTRRWALGTLAVGGAAAVGAAAVGWNRRDEPERPAETTRNTAPVRRMDLVDQRSVKGRLGYGQSIRVGGLDHGIVTATAAAGSVVRRGGVLYRTDNSPVVLFYGKLPMWRTLRPGVKGPDVTAVQTNLGALGLYAAKPDGTFGSTTTTAVRRWRRSLGLSDTGVIELGRICYAPGEVRVAERLATIGAPVSGPVLAVTPTAKAVSVTLSSADRDLARTGRAATIAMPDGGQVKAVVSDVVRADSGPQGDQETITVTLAIADQKPVQPLDDISVEVRFPLSEHRGVLAVPVTALLALREGGYGLETVAESGTQILPVEVGLFAQGMVEVSGPELAEGMLVIVP